MLVHILENVDLRLYSTMRLGGKTRYLAEANNEDEVKQLVLWARQKQLPFLAIGEGSNIVWRDEGFNGLIMVNKLFGRDVLQQDEKSGLVRLGAGENWDKAVEWSLEQGFSGLEFLSRIPGTVGAAPVQNIGAYGTELADLLKEVAVYDSHSDKFVSITNKHCRFAYRTSRFKTDDRGRYIILNITLKLKKGPPVPPFYESLQNYFDEHGITEFTPQIIRNAVTEIRKIKLPDPSVAANNGSFFTNPIIESPRFEKLREQYPDIKGWPIGNGKIKIAAGWMVEKAGFKGVHDQSTGMAVWPYSALVLVNERAKKTADLLVFRQRIIDRVKEMFGITLEQEPELLP